MGRILKDFIVIEGLDGAGTTTQLKILSKKLAEMGKNVFSTFEPTDGEIGRLIRRVLRHEVEIDKKSLAILYSADRNEHVFGKNGILEKLEEGQTVISDRYFYSSYAYQLLDADYDFIRNLNDYPSPEYLIFIDPPVDTCLERIIKRADEAELFEKKELLIKVRKNYQKCFERMDKKTKLIHIEGIFDIEETSQKIFQGLNLL